MTARAASQGFPTFDSTFKPLTDEPPSFTEMYATRTAKVPDPPPGPDIDGGLDIMGQYLGLSRSALLEALAPIVADHRINTIAAELKIPPTAARDLLLRLSPTPGGSRIELLEARVESKDFTIRLQDKTIEILAATLDRVTGRRQDPRPPTGDASNQARRSWLDRVRGKT